MDIASVSQQLQRLGINIAPSDLRIDGRIHRVPVDGQGRSKKNGWYVLHTMYRQNGEAIITGRYGNWRTGESEAVEIERREWSDEEKRDYAERMAQARQAAAEEQERLHEECRQRAANIWEKCPDSGSSPYLRRKRVAAYQVRFSRDNLIIPIFNPAGSLVSLQFIAADGSNKKFLTGTPKKGNFHVIPNLGALDGVDLVAVCEGYATGASIHQATGWPVVVAFDAGNLLPVSEALRKRFPAARFVFCADRDESGTGERSARAAADEVGGAIVVMPDFGVAA